MRPLALLVPLGLLAAAARADSVALDLPLAAKGGQIVVAKITPIGDVDSYALFLATGDVLTVAVKDIRPSIGLDTTIHVYDPSGTDVTPANVKGQGARKATLVFTAPSTGRFVVSLNGDATNLAGSTGDYQAAITIKHGKIANGVFADPGGGAISMTFQSPANATVSLSASTKKGGVALTDLKRPDGTSEPKFATALKSKPPRSASLSKFLLTGGDGAYQIVGTYDAGSSVTVKVSLLRDEKKRTRRIAEEPRFDPSLPPFPSQGVAGTTLRVAGTDFDDVTLVNDQNQVTGHVYPTFGVGGIAVPAASVVHPNGSIFEFPAPAGLAAGQRYDLTAVNADGQGVQLTEAFFVVPPPTVTGYSIGTAGPAGGRHVRILGSGFLKNDVAIFDTTIVQPIPPVKDDHIDVVAPAHAVGDVTVKIRDEYGQLAAAPTPFTYLNVGSNRIVSLEPPTFEAMGGERVVVKGVDFDATTILMFDGAILSYTPQSANQLAFTTPQHADATVKVRVTDQYEQSSAVDVRVKGFANVTSTVVPAPVTTSGAADGWRGGRVLTGDVNGDGFPDVILLRPESAFGADVNRSRARLLLDDGHGALTDATASKMPTVFGDEDWRAKDGVLADLDGDGDLDLAIVIDGPVSFGQRSSLRILKNDGTGAFTDFTASGAPATTAYGDLNQGVAVAAARLDAGASYDLVIVDVNYYTDAAGAPYAGTRVLLNDGTGVFTRSAGALPAVTTSGANQYQGNALAVADVNADGKPDIVLTRTQPTPNPASSGSFLLTATLLTNDGAAAFTDVSATKLPAASDPEYLQGDRVYLADLEGDGAPELIVSSIIRVVSPVTGQLASTPALRVFTNDGSGTFGASSISMPAADDLDQLQANAVAAVDLNGDGARDLLVVSSRAPNAGARAARLLARSGSAFVVGSLGLPDASAGDDLRGQDVAVADLDGDGAPDLVVARDEGVETVRNTIVLHGPLKDFTDQTTAAIPAPVAAAGSADGWRARRLLVGDVDGDFRPDIVLLRPEKASGADANRPRVRLLTANGQGGFVDVTSTKIPPVSGDEDWRAKAGVLVDIDGDGDLDLVIVTDDAVSGGARSSLRILRNNGLGQFSDATSSLGPAITGYGDLNQGVAVAAVKRDVVNGGEVRTLNDLVVVHTSYFTDSTSGTVYRPGTRVYVNDGSGTYSRKLAAIPSISPNAGTQYQGDAVLSGDVNGDGKADILVFRAQPGVDPQNGSNYLLAASLLTGDGNAVFTDVSASKLPAKSDPEYLQADRAAFVDVDHDGRPEILLASSARLLSRPSGNPVATPALRLFKNDGSGGYAPVANAFAGASGLEQFQADGVAIGDLYGTGESAIFLVSTSAPVAGGRGGRLLARSGSTWTAFPRALPDPPLSDDLRGADVAFADVDSDGDLDLIVVRDEPNDAVRNTLVLKSVRK